MQKQNDNGSVSERVTISRRTKCLSCPYTDGSYRQSSPLSPHALPVNVTQRASLRYCSLYFLRFPQQHCLQLHTSLSSGPFRPQPPRDSRRTRETLGCLDFNAELSQRGNVGGRDRRGLPRAVRSPSESLRRIQMDSGVSHLNVSLTRGRRGSLKTFHSV